MQKSSTHVAALCCCSLIFVFASTGSICAQSIDVTAFPSESGVVCSPINANAAISVPIGDLDGDGFGDFALASPYASPYGDVSSGKLDIVYGKSTEFSNVDLAEVESDTSGGFHINGTENFGRLGSNSAPAGDFNGDGLADLIIGSNSGAAYVLLGKIGGYGNLDQTDLETIDSHWVKIYHPTKAVGFVTQGLGDINADSFSDIAIAGTEPLESFPTRFISVIFGKPDPENINLAEFQGDGQDGFTITLPPNSGKFTPVCASRPADLNDDGYSDIIFSSEVLYNWGEGDALAVIYGRESGFQDIVLGPSQPTDVTMIGQRNFQSPSQAAGGFAGDLNGDGYGDMYIGDPAEDKNSRNQGGSVAIVFGKEDLPAQYMTDGYSSGSLRLFGAEDDWLGEWVAPAGDVDADGFDDLLVSTLRPFSGHPESICCYVIYGSAEMPAEIDLANPLPQNVGFLFGGAAKYNSNSPVATSAGDVNGDGYSDLLLIAANPATPGDDFAFLAFGRPKAAAVGNWELY